MSEIAIRVQKLGKQYHIGALQKNGGAYSYKSLRDSISNAAGLPFRAARALFSGNGQRVEPQDDTIWALKDVSFEVKQGEVVGVIGRNGAGKSTLLKLLSRITEPTTGRAEIHGRVASLLEVGTGFHPELTGRDNVYLNGAILGMKRAEIIRKFDEIVAFAEVEKFIDTPVKHYSSGMYLRLAFAVAAHLDPEILIVDEVLAVGDAEFQKKCLGKMQDVSQGGRTVIFVSHNLPAVQRLCTQAVWIDSGSIVKEGSTDEVVSSYLSNEKSQSNHWIRPDHYPKKQQCIQEITVSNLGNDPLAPITANDEIGISILAYNFKSARECQIALRVSSVDDTPVFTTASTDTAASLTLLREGPTEFQLKIPANFLTPGIYNLIFAILIPGGSVIDDVTNELRFQINKTLNHASYFADGRRGVVTPLIEWATIPGISA